MREFARKLKNAARKVRNTAIPAEYDYSVDSPRRSYLSTRTVTIEGWLLPKVEASAIKMRAVNNGKTHRVKYGLPRPDVANAFPALPREIAAASGFVADFEYEDGLIELEIDLGKGFKRVHSLRVEYSPEQLPVTIFNPDLGSNMAEHENLIDNKSRYFHEPAAPGDFQAGPDDPRLLTFYLPQFHPFPENDAAWGKGFTEWTNVTSAAPRFVGHLQPILPADFGFYDLRVESILKEQIDLAKQHGIHGFCFYYYWFSGKRLLEMPLDKFLSRKEWDFNFAICWANENWTKRWDGRDSDVIVAQQYRDEDPEDFIRDVEPILADSRYVHHNGKPLLLVYRASELKDPQRYVDIWRKYFRDKHGKELYLVSVMSFDDADPTAFGFDAALDFAPQTAFFKNDAFEDHKYPFQSVGHKLLDVNFEGTVADYRKIALNRKQYDLFDFPSLKSVTPSWDNDARKKGSGFVLQNSNPDLYGAWLDNVLELESARQGRSPIVFINAWNEWAEGAILEPSAHYGHATLNRTTQVLARHSADPTNRETFPMYGIKRSQDADTAVIIHLFYPELWPQFSKALGALPEGRVDIYVTLMQKDAAFAEEIRAKFPSAFVIIVPNRGRDVLPFVHLARRLDEHGYTYLLKLHSKKTVHREDGADWFAELLRSLLPSAQGVGAILRALEAGAGIVGPEGHYLSLDRFMAGNEPRLQSLLQQLNLDRRAASLMDDLSTRGYFGGTMFWARFDTLRPLLSAYLMPEDFESESGQVNVTTHHAIERLIGLLPELTGKSTWVSGPNGLHETTPDDVLDEYPYAASTTRNQ